MLRYCELRTFSLRYSSIRGVVCVPSLKNDTTLTIIRNRHKRPTMARGNPKRIATVQASHVGIIIVVISYKVIGETNG